VSVIYNRSDDYKTAAFFDMQKGRQPG
jgi:hypothetical protein